MYTKEIGCYAYENNITCKGDVIDVCTVLEHEPEWQNRQTMINQFVESHQALHHGVVVIHSLTHWATEEN
jgi:hypothetical protein